jgi:hypothetical protein
MVSHAQNLQLGPTSLSFSGVFFGIFGQKATKKKPSKTQ